MDSVAGCFAFSVTLLAWLIALVGLSAYLLVVVDLFIVYLLMFLI